MPVLRACQTIHYFIQSAIATAGDDQLPPVTGGLLRNLCGMARAGGFRQVRFNAACRKHAPRFIQQPPARISAIARIGVVNQ